MAQLVARLTGGQEAVSSSLATRTILKKAETVDFQGFSFFLFSYFTTLDIIGWKTANFANINKEKDIVRNSFYCRAMSLIFRNSKMVVLDILSLDVL